jgi:hypothetical protein
MATEDLFSHGLSVADFDFNDGAACCIDVSLVFLERPTRLPRG